MVKMVVDFNRAEFLVRQLAAALGSRRLYGADHRRSREALQRFTTSLHGFFRQSPRSSFSLGVRGGQITYEGLPVGSTATLARAASHLEGKRFSGFSFRADARSESVAEFLEWIETPGAERPESGGGVELLRADDTADAAVEDELPEQLKPFRVPTRVYRSTADVLQRVFADVTWNRDPDFEEVAELSRWTADEAFRLGTRMLAPIFLIRHDTYTYQHSINVFLLATVLLQSLARDVRELTGWARAALLHDIGKARVPAEILGKRGVLTAEEFGLVKRHTEFGAQILMECGEPDPLAIEVAYCHHMRDEGRGYPEPRPGLKPGPVTNVIQVADMFEALTSHRPYKAPYKVADALRILLETPGMQSKRPAVQVLLARITHAPPGSEVELSTGEKGVVLESREDDPGRPRVLLLSDCNGLDLAEPVELDLKRAPAGDDGTPRRLVNVRLGSPDLACSP